MKVIVSENEFFVLSTEHDLIYENKFSHDVSLKFLTLVCHAEHIFRNNTRKLQLALLKKLWRVMASLS